MDGNNKDEAIKGGSKIAKKSMPRRRMVSAASSSSSPGLVAEMKRKKDQLAVIREIKRKKDYYKILGLEKKCSVEDIRKAFRKLSLKVHPDKNPAPGAEDSFKKVLNAYECLSNDERRRNYDLEKRVGVRKPKHLYAEFWPEWEENHFALVQLRFGDRGGPIYKLDAPWTMKQLMKIVIPRFELQTRSFKMEYKDEEEDKMIPLPKEDDLEADNYLTACLYRFISLSKVPTITISIKLI